MAKGGLALGRDLPDKSFNVMYRMYAPLEPWFDKTWKLGDFELIK